MRGPLLRRPRTLLALTVAIVSFGVFSSSIGSGALPADSLPAFGVTTGDGSLSTIAELGDVNGDGFGDYAVGLPSADVGGSADAGIVYVFLGHGGALPATPTAVDLAAASFTISGHAGEMLGYTIVGDDVNGDHLSDIAIGAPMAGAPGKSGGGAVYVIFGRASPADVTTTSLSAAGLTTDPGHPTSSIGSRYDGFQQNSHTGMALAALPDVNGDGFNDLAVGAPDADLHITGGGGVAVLYGKAQGVHITLNDLWEKAYPYFFHIDFPALADQHAGMSVASVGDMTGDGLPDIAIGAPHADFNGTDSGSVWIISAHIAPIVGCTQPVPPETGVAPGSVCPWIKLNGLTAGQGYRIDGAAAGDQLGTSLAGVGDQTGDGIRDLAIGAAASSPNGRAGSGEVVVVPGQANQATRNLAVTPPLQTVYGAEAGAGAGRLAGRSGRHRRQHHRPGRRSGRSLRRRRRLSPARRPGHDLRPCAGHLQDRTCRGGRHDRQRGRGRARSRRRRRRCAGRRAGRGRQRRLVPRRRQRDARPAAASQPAGTAGAAARSAASAGRSARRPHSARAARDPAVAPGHDRRRQLGRPRCRPAPWSPRRRPRPPSPRPAPRRSSPGRRRRSCRSARSRSPGRSTTRSTASA